MISLLFPSIFVVFRFINKASKIKSKDKPFLVKKSCQKKSIFFGTISVSAQVPHNVTIVRLTEISKKENISICWCLLVTLRP